MFEKDRKYYADWRDKQGKRKRKSFISKRAALIYEAEQKQLNRRKRKKKSTAPQARIVLTTVANPEEAAKLGRTLVEERLAACATMISGVQSIYRWQGKVESSTETLLLIKTGQEHLAALEARLHELHSYETPEFLVLEVDAASQPYLDWMQESLRRP
jgi:periplasmic divalent cation tolerance protein